jgi:hypothetical protein
MKLIQALAKFRCKYDTYICVAGVRASFALLGGASSLASLQPLCRLRCVACLRCCLRCCLRRFHRLLRFRFRRFRRFRRQAAAFASVAGPALLAA